jgi:hypothetical protein
MGDPCQTIQAGINSAGTGETVHIDDTPAQYAAVLGVALDNGKSLMGDDFVAGDENASPEPDTVVQAGDVISSGPAIRVSGPAGTISNLRILGGSGAPGGVALILEATATVIDSVLADSDGNVSSCLARVLNVGNTSVIGPGNTFVDPTPTATPLAGVCAVTSGAPSIVSNDFTDLNHGVQINGGNTSVTSNNFTGIRGNIANAAIEVVSGIPTITANRITNPGDGMAAGIKLEETADDVGGLLRRNTILDHRIGVIVNDTEAQVELFSDLIAGSLLVGIASNNTDMDNDAIFSATNVTVANSAGAEVSVNGSDLTLISSLIDDGGISTGPFATVCQISFSRGPTMTPGGAGCDNFQTTADPGFVDPGAANYHLAAGSAMIDAGADFPPPPGSLDIDGGSRATDGNGDGTVRRDIGADETATVPFVPPTGTPPAPAPGAKKKCKKKKRPRAAAKKKCKRKKRR